MDYYNTAFDGFAPHRDKDAAVKFALNGVLMQHRLRELAELALDGSQLGGVEGEPGWLLERRDIADEGNEAAYPDWPAGALFRAYVDPDVYELLQPEFFMSRAVFAKYVAQAIEAYVSADFSKATDTSVTALRNAIAV